MLGVLGWIGFQQLPGAAGTSSTATAEPIGLTDLTANAAAPGLTSDSTPSASDPDNPFAAFVKQPPAAGMGAEQTASEKTVAAPARKSARPRPNAGIVSLASNETPATEQEATVELFPATTGRGRIPEVINSGFDAAPASGAAPADDPFAAFTAPQQSEAPAAPRPGSNRPRAMASDVVEADWSTDGATRQVEPVQFNGAPAVIQEPAAFDPQARPIQEFGAGAAEPVAPALQPAATADFSPFATAEPISPAPTSRRNPLPTATEYSPRTNFAETTGFSVPQSAEPANDPRDETLHVVQPGETYWSIARQRYGAGRYFQALAEYNKPRISDQQSLKPGMKVLIPSAATLDARYGKLMLANGHALPPAGPAAGLTVDRQGRPLYVVGEGDTLGEIASRFLGRTIRAEEILKLNQEQLKDANSLKIGMVLVMPEDAAEVPQQPAGSIRR